MIFKIPPAVKVDTGRSFFTVFAGCKGLEVPQVEQRYYNIVQEKEQEKTGFEKKFCI